MLLFMLRAVSIVVLMLLASVISGASPSASTWISAAEDVLTRVIPSHAKFFKFVATNATSYPSLLPELYNDYFTVEASHGIVTITGTSGVSLTSGAYWYLKEVTGCQVTWGNNGTGNQLALPDVLPDVASTTVNASVPIRYGWNMVTFSYSSVWWDKERWQTEIDWMALHGVNFPLALTGQEYIWLKLFERYNVTLEQLEPWLSGPAFLAWQRAGNIQGFAGPLSYHWITQQADLQSFLLSQMRSLGMRPILPCFAGHVPAVARTVWPNATFTQSASWNHFPANETYVWYLDPTDPLFAELGGIFTEVTMELFGTDHYYSCDTFNEVDPKSTQPSYLRAASAAVHESIAAKDPQGIWVMQAWLFHSPYWNHSPALVEAYLSGVSNNSMLILDLNSEAGVLATKYDQYYGKPWVWNMLHNYGGVRGVYGNLTEIATSPFRHLTQPGSRMIGIGFTPEAIEQNPVMYEMLTATFWADGPIAVMPWLERYVAQRYATNVSSAWTAWQLLFQAVYDQPGEPRSEIEWVPHWEQASFGWQNGNATAMFHAFEAFLETAIEMGPMALTNGPFMYDFVDVTRQAATMFFSDMHRQLSSVGWIMQTRMHNVTGSIGSVGAAMLTLISTLDSLLATNINYLFGVWTTGAVNLAGSANETSLFLFNAKNQVTLWGPSAQICDYAAKAWSGLYLDYYYHRWRVMMDTLLKVSENPSGSWNSALYELDLLNNFEIPWCYGNTTYTPNPSTSGPNAVQIARTIHSAIHLEASMLFEQYDVHADSDSIQGNFIFNPMWTQEPKQLAMLCNLIEECVGFNSDGFMKRTLGSVITSPGSTLYVKKGLTSIAKSKLRQLRDGGIGHHDAIADAMEELHRFHLKQQKEKRPTLEARNPVDEIIQRIPRHEL